MPAVFRNGFEWGQVGWSQPNVPLRPLCAYCAGLIKENSGELILRGKDGRSARFCEACVDRWVEVVPKPAR